MTGVVAFPGGRQEIIPTTEEEAREAEIPYRPKTWVVMAGPEPPPQLPTVGKEEEERREERERGRQWSHLQGRPLQPQTPVEACSPTQALPPDRQTPMPTWRQRKEAGQVEPGSGEADSQSLPATLLPGFYL